MYSWPTPSKTYLVIGTVYQFYFSKAFYSAGVNGLRMVAVEVAPATDTPSFCTASGSGITSLSFISLFAYNVSSKYLNVSYANSNGITSSNFPFINNIGVCPCHFMIYSALLIWFSSMML